MAEPLHGRWCAEIRDGERCGGLLEYRRRMMGDNTIATLLHCWRFRAVIEIHREPPFLGLSPADGRPTLTVVEGGQ